MSEEAPAWVLRVPQIGDGHVSTTPGHSWPLGVCPPHLPCQAAARLAAAHLQAGANPPIEDGEVGVRGQQHGREVHLLADADDGSHFEVEGLQRGCGGRERSEVGIGAPGFSEAAVGHCGHRRHDSRRRHPLTALVTATTSATWRFHDHHHHRHHHLHHYCRHRHHHRQPSSCADRPPHWGLAPGCWPPAPGPSP